ncbi:MAG: enolase C-terminal domain-like protein [Planctomycetaceae bacterium]
MSDNLIKQIRTMDVRYKLEGQDGSDAIHKDPVYSYAVTLLELGDGEYGTGLSYSLGRGSEVVVKAIEAFASFVVGQNLEAIMSDFARFWRSLADESQLRWIGPHKGAVHLALASVSSALIDAWARKQGKPLWKLLLEMPPAELIKWVDLKYLSDFITREEALELLGADRESNPYQQEVLEKGYPAYDTSVGWLGHSLEEVTKRSKATVAAGFRGLKLKVGSPNLEDDLKRIQTVREAVGPDVDIMTDANQCWSVTEAIRAGKALAELGCYWLEEPTHPDDILGYQRIAKEATPIKLASGECVSNAVLFKNLIQSGGLHFLQADVLRLGGLPEWLSVALMAKKAGLPVVPHAADMGQIHQHLVIWNSVYLGRKPCYVEAIQHLKEKFTNPANIQQGRYQLPDAPGASTRLVECQP